MSALEQTVCVAADDAIKRYFGIRQVATLSEAEAFLRISHSTMKTLVRDGKVSSIKVGGSRRILVDSLREIAERGTR